MWIARLASSLCGSYLEWLASHSPTVLVPDKVKPTSQSRLSNINPNIGPGIFGTRSIVQVTLWKRIKTYNKFYYITCVI